MTIRRRRWPLAGLIAAAVLSLVGCNFPGEQPASPGNPPPDALQNENRQLKAEIEQLRRRLSALEPDTPATSPLSDTDRQIALFETAHSTVPASEVLRRGERLSFSPVVSDDRWKRPGYSGVWHSTFMDGKFSSVARLVELASHRGFVYTGGLSASQELLYGLGLVTDPNPSANRNPSLPLQDTRSDHVSVLVVYGRVEGIWKLGRQVAVAVEPAPAGYQEVRLDPRELLAPNSGDATLLFHFVTPEGREFDRTVADLSPVLR